ncbi:transcription initiation factor TFIIA large subunit [Exophiala viscosa]|uniref:Transcription initiation factor TFIIA large subunit n=1 Tax=Exophiala viscosa TaxID=2486360 RepID=A0AAN6DQW7_9EURO|nr:transcription initiation factor TFIIA large subunit [Exophiala viscosa]KAI1619727.1 transcription initiation factor TFIIA large subunit [Exophiala viscosa]
MSKTSVGDVYAKVINDVCEQSRQDFEEGGVELATLDLLKSEWQKKLSGLRVAQLPWDPPPVSAKEQPLPSNAKPIPSQTLPSNGNAINTPPPPPQVPSQPAIKTENNPAPSFPPQPLPVQTYQAPSFQQGQPMTARDRAAMNLHQSFGQRAGPQIAQLQSTQPRVPLQSSAAASSSYIKQEDSQTPFPGVQDYPSAPSSAPLKSSQTDGTGDARDDWNSEYAQRKAYATAHGAEGDRLIRAHFKSSQQAMEGGGLLLALDERHMPSQATTRKVNSLAGEGSTQPSAPPCITRAQGDAAGDEDDDVDDEDAINSDLDDPDDLAANEENGEDTDQVMLCTYDKVQRVKNKWKCTLKDGILRVEGNEYVFHKGQGEFEW